MNENSASNRGRNISQNLSRPNICSNLDARNISESVTPPFKISIVNQVIWDSLSVAKIIKYPSAQKEFKPFAQARICYEPGKGFRIRMWSFEVDPSSLCREYNSDSIDYDSVLTFTVNFYPAESKKILMIDFNRNGIYRFKIREDKKEILMGPTFSGLEKKKRTSDSLPIETFSGEDLQGIYWGVEFIISCELILNLYDKVVCDFKSGHKIEANFIKECKSTGNFHQGGFNELNPNDPYGSLVKCILVEY